ncbi:hypothetical protein BH11BAC2_BH11BAC2_05740 [soil metagenome]
MSDTATLNSINCSIIIDSNTADLYSSYEFLKNFGVSKEIVCFSSGLEAICYLQEKVALHQKFPNLIFFSLDLKDIKGEDFLTAFKIFESRFRKNSRLILMKVKQENSRAIELEKFPEIEIILNKPLLLHTDAHSLTIIRSKKNEIS